MKKFFKVALLASLALLIAFPVFGAGARDGRTINLVGGSMLPEAHIFFRATQKFAERFHAIYQGEYNVNISLHHSGTLGTEMDAIEFMIQGVAVDFYVISPAWAATWEPTAPIVDAPFLFRDVGHWQRVLEQGGLRSIEETMLRTGIRFLGYGGGSTRQLISRFPVRHENDFPTTRLRVQGSPVHQRAFSAAGFQATPLDFMEVYNAIATGVLDALENESAGFEQMRFFEVAPYWILTNHQVSTRILAFSERRFQTLPACVQEAILIAGREAAAWHVETELYEEQQIIDRLVRNFGVTVIPFDNTVMRQRALPAVRDFAAEIGALAIFDQIQAIE
ncbi:MAG: TRAP transporter substrate-binding protein [Treponema sp.]|nr:TRAP transporter substrate-binding protein [Treponema sp.]